MTVRLFVVILAGLAVLGACSGDQADEAEVAATTEAAADTTADPYPPLPTVKDQGHLSEHGEAGFQIYWPGGCDKIKEQVSDGATRRAEQEFIYTCDRDGALGRGAGVRVLMGAKGPGGTMVDPPFVVSLVERQLETFGVKIIRQRPLAADGIEGVEVQAAKPDGAGEVWIRGLIIGVDVYLLMVWDDAGGVFADPEQADFFASFRTL